MVVPDPITMPVVLFKYVPALHWLTVNKLFLSFIEVSLTLI